MKELTKEHFDKAVKALITDIAGIKSNMATKADVAKVEKKVTAVEQKVTAVEKKITDSVDDLARIIAKTVAIPMQQHFEQLHSELSVRERMEHVESDLRKVKMQLRIH
jgi:hypothetical protein